MGSEDALDEERVVGVDCATEAYRRVDPSIGNVMSVGVGLPVLKIGKRRRFSLLHVARAYWFVPAEPV